MGEVVDEPTVGTHSQVHVEGEELGVFEGLEAIEDERLIDCMVLHEGVMQEQAVTPKTRHMPGDGVGRDTQDSGGLSEAGPFGNKGSDGSQELRPPEPVFGREGGRGESASAVGAAVVLNGYAISPSSVTSVEDKAPIGAARVELTLSVGTVGRLEATWAAGTSVVGFAHTPWS